MTEYHPAQITDVAPRSVAARAGLREGDVLLALNGIPLRDVIDVQFYAAEPELEFLIERAGRQKTLRANRRYGQTLGLAFETELFDDRIRACRNNCDFCFVSQMAPGLRGPLYVKDDDYRLSFLHGNYITLTNLDESDWERIEEQHLSPLYVSVHATEPDVRVGLMHNPRAGQIMEHLRRLADMDIEIHTQAVLAPGRNDGAHLDRTIADLASLYPAVADVTVVPVGLTRWHNPDLRPYTDAEAAVVLAQTLDWQGRLRAELDVGFVYPSDEWFLRAGAPIPALADYDGLLPALVENGVGMVRLFLDGWDALQAKLAQLGGPHQTWLTGMLFAPVLHEKAREFATRTGLSADVIAVPNRAFGETVTVAGLLTVGDILAELREREIGDVLVLPDELFRGPDGRALDDRSATEIQHATGRPVFIVAQIDERWQVRPAVL
jgi:putative radical SAM enzyme (TIGR03279 family)